MNKILTALFLSAGVCAPFASAETPCPVTHYVSPNEAETALNRGDVKQAIALYKGLLGKDASDPVVVSGAVVAFIRGNDLESAENALAPALAAHADDAHLLVAKGDVDYRSGHIQDADRDYTAATHANPCYAMGYLGEVRIARVGSMNATAIRLLKTAHALDPDNPRIAAAWSANLPKAQRLAVLKTALETKKDMPEQQRASMTSQIDRLQADLDSGDHGCHADAIPGKVDIPFAPLMEDPNHLAAWGLEARVNNHTSRLEVDTGASGIYIGRAQAEAMGLKAAGKSAAWGFGDQGPQSGYYAFADTIKVGPITFHNCRVEVSDRRSVIERDGLIGADLFAQFLITLDYPGHKMTLAPLPGAPAGGAEEDETDQDNTAGSSVTDRYQGPELKGFVPVYKIGTKLLLPSTINGKWPYLMVLDSGDAVVNLDYEVARSIGIKLQEDTWFKFRGVSGYTKHIYGGGDIDLKFANGRAKIADLFVENMSPQSASFGTRVAGFLGFTVLRNLAFQIDYRDGLVNFSYDPKSDHRDRRLDGYDNACVMYGQCEHDH